MPAKKLILHVAAECTPFVKIGGLADVVGSLPQALATTTNHSAVVLPLYEPKQLQLLTKVTSHSTTIDFAGVPTNITVHQGRRSGAAVDYYFLQHTLFQRQSPYSTDIEADIELFSFFSYCVVELLGSLIPRPDIIHCHDWHTGLIPTLIDNRYQRETNWPTIPTVFTIHNLAHQGIGSHKILSKIKLRPDNEPALLEDYYDDSVLNILKVAILSADKVTTVSPTYAREIMAGSQDFGLASYLKRRKYDFSGILNGIDTKTFDPAHDQAIYRRYTAKTWKQNKVVNKHRLQTELGLPHNDLPLATLITRLTPQKGIDLLLPLLPKLTKSMQLIILGQGDASIEQQVSQLAQRFPQAIQFRPQLDLTLAQKIYAGADILLMPSRFEPCGLGQMIAMRYGTVPVIRSTGGLKDSVKNNLTGFSFNAYSSAALLTAIRHALAVYQSPKRWYTVVNRCLKQDFSWVRSAKQYQKIYNHLL